MLFAFIISIASRDLVVRQQTDLQHTSFVKDIITERKERAA
jgi:hypothetical protein